VIDPTTERMTAETALLAKPVTAVLATSARSA
jgi:hypothetical protein